MKILVIPDVHGRSFWKDAIKENLDKVDKVVFLGDYLDPYQDEDEEYDFEESIEKLLEIIDLKMANKDKVVLLLGNHDCHYISSLYCKLAKSTRYNSTHAKRVKEIFNEFIDLFQICYVTEIEDKKVIFSHAGISKYWADKCDIKLDDNLEENVNNLFNNDDGIAKLAILGKYRTWFGGEKTGSPLWCDVREFYDNDNKEFDNDVIQIFGHTRLNKGAIAHEKNFYCIDAQLAYILDDNLNLKQA